MHPIIRNLFEELAGVMETDKFGTETNVPDVVEKVSVFTACFTCNTCPGICTPLPLVFSLMVSTNSVLMSAYQLSAKI
jgi:hypothetical protein